MWSDISGRLRAIWEGQNRQTRIISIGVIAAVVLGLVGLGYLYFGKSPTYETLFANLSDEDAATVTQRLKDDKVPYHLSADGHTISVPSQYMGEERVSIAGANVLKGGGTGYELFDRTNFGMTDFQERLDKTRAIEGELQRTIDQLNPVDSSRVHIAAPEAALYTSTQQPTTASVAIKTKAGQELNARQVRGITLLVANAVEGLKPENVTIVNQDGQVLSSAAVLADGANGTSSADALKMTAEQQAAKIRYESDLQQSVQTMLDETLGKRRAVARVSTKMDFDANSSESKTYAPQGTILSQQSKRESYVGTPPQRQAAIGVPGTTSNIGTYQATQNNNTANGRYNKSENTTNYNISETNAKHIDAPGKVTQTSVAVIVNSAPDPTASATGAPTGAAAATPYQLTPANVQQIRNVVIAAAGLNLQQGDQVSVEAIPFNPSVLPATGGANGTGTGLAAAGPFGIPLWALLAVGGAAALAGVGLLVMRGRRQSSKFAPMMDLPSFDTSLAEELPPFEEHPILEGAPGLAAPIRSAADLTREQMIEYVTTVAQENPDSIAKLVKLWLAE